jgi:hypothetical protein
MRNPGPKSNSPPAISDAEWEELWRRVRQHAWKRFYWLHDRIGEDLDAIVHQAFVDTWTGKRRWPPVDRATGETKDHVSLYLFLCETVRSLVSHVWEREKRRISFDAPANDLLHDREFIEKLLASETNSLFAPPPNVEASVDYNRLTEVMLGLLEDDQLKSIVRLWRADPDLKPSEIAAVLKLTMPQMQAAQKRLRRFLRDWKENNERER